MHPPTDLWANDDYHSENRAETVDINGDGLLDVFVAWVHSGTSSRVTYINIGDSFVDSRDLTEEDIIKARTASPQPFPDFLNKVEAAAYLRLESISELEDYIDERGVSIEHRDAGKSWSVAREHLKEVASFSSKPIDDMEVRALLEKAESASYLPNFRLHAIDMMTLLEMSSDDLKEVGVKAFGARSRILRETRMILGNKSSPNKTQH